MRQDEYPPGWDADRVQRVMTHYERQSEEEAGAEEEAAFEAEGATLMEIPKDLVPAVREMIANYEKTARAKSA